MMIITMAISKKGDVKVPPTDDVPKKKLHFYRMSRPGPHPFWWKPEWMKKQNPRAAEAKALV